MKNGKYKLDANQIRQICLGLARGKSFRAISRQTGLSINRVNSLQGIMHNNRMEQSFRELNVLRNSMMANDTIHGAETLALYYSLYKTSQMSGLDFKYYLREVITTMMKHIDQIEFEKNEKGTIIGYRGHHIPNEVLESIAPWNLAKKFDSEKK